MIAFEHPEAFWLVPVWAAAWWGLPRGGLKRPLRIAVLLTLLLAWANPFVDRSTPGVDLWVMLDQSDSAADVIGSQTREMETLLTETRGSNDRLFFVDFADEAVVRDPLASTVLTGRRDASRIGHALQHTLSRLDPDRSSRLLLVTDGYATDPLERAGERLLAEGVPLDLRLVRRGVEGDVRVEDLSAPLRPRPGEPFLVEAVVAGPPGESAEVILSRDGIEVNRRTVELVRGEARVQWAAELREAGAAEFAVRVVSDADTVSGNNRQHLWVEAAGGQRILLISAFADDPVAAFLRREGLDVQLVTEPGELGPGSLSGVATVWIHNVHAANIPRDFLEAVDFYVREQGGGLVMVGGKASFGSGGYYESPIDELLPVSMELKEEDRRLSVAMAVVMDRSGSMSMGAGGGMTKMDLANAGAARAIELLGDSDTITVFAVDTQPHQIVPLSRVGRNRDQLSSMVRRIQSAGGGIYVFNGLEAAWKELKDAPQQQRHIILFADAADAEQPEGVGELIREMTQNKTTVSVIALGNDKDPDAPFLEQIAVDGGGRLFFNSDPATLPSVFAQETVTVSRSAFLEEPTGTEATASWRELAATAMDWPALVDGYNLSYLREEASQSLRTTDGYAAPLVAHWSRGIGRVAAVSMPLGGPFSEQVRAWPQYGDFVRTLNRWSMRGELPPGLGLRTRRIGDTLRIQLFADTDWQERFALHSPVLVTVRDADREPRRHTWRRIRPGQLETDIRLDAADRLRGVIRIGQQVLPFGPVSGRSGAEWERDPQPVQALVGLSAASGGEERLNLADSWRRVVQSRPTGTRTIWLILCGGLFLLEALWSRIGGQRITFAVERRPRVARIRRTPRRSDPEGGSNPEPEPASAPEPERRSAFRKAKHRG